MISDMDVTHLRRCVTLAKQAVEKGDKPFGSVLVSGEGEVLAEDHNRASSGDPTQHPEFALARWAAQHMTPEERQKATVYTSGEHCPMCAAAHGMVGLGRIVYATSSEQLSGWLHEMAVPNQSRVIKRPIQDVISNTIVEGPVPELAKQVRDLHRQFYEKAR